ncbi:hypothetical protein [Planotetraspora kaengkrachanensis]|uniref:Uncharacterized protein n=1 Tax=Planotetraspora kaengkrachanensis TaxID=575193 RepID=A0A8J3LVD4_9ACTN|nr:hypothetical protein [Planotetraspora kaengkrachanensis]GIG79808.1 hypothetical protein Pka01_29350 [Planotetraspora kaengkrachanensis]
MSTLEDELRQAMTEETDSLRAAPDLVDQVVRLSRHRRHRRLRLVATVAAVFLVAGAVPAFVAFQRADRTAAVRPVATIDGVDVRYLPDDLGEPEALPLKERDRRGTVRLQGKALMWSEGNRFVQVSVYRTERSVEDVQDILALNILPGADESTLNDGYVSSPDRTDRMWVAEPGLVLRVMTSVSLKDDLDRIAAGLRVQPEVPDERITHLPEGLDRVDGVEVRGLPTGFGAPVAFDVIDHELTGKAVRWSQGDRSIQVTVYRPGEPVPDRTALGALLAIPEGNTWLRRGSGMMSAGHDDLVWVEHEHLVLRVTTSASAGKYLEQIALALRVPWDHDLAGVRLGYMPDDLRDASGEVHGVNDGQGRWFNRNDGGSLSVEVVRGPRAQNLQSLRQVSWPTDEHLFDVHETAVRGVPALEGRVMRADRSMDKGRMLLWVIRPGLGVRIWATPDLTKPMMAIARGVTPVPPVKG